MADVKICDRCGKTIVANAVQSIGFGTWRYSLFNPNVSHKTHSNWDLCLDCGKKLERFLHGDELTIDAQKTDQTASATVTQPSKPVSNDSSAKKKV
jgi:hypothetical protein